MRILFLGASGQLGGAEISLLDVLAGLRGSLPDWPLGVMVGEPGPFVQRARDLGVEVQVLDFPKGLSSLGDAGAGGPAGMHVEPFRLATRFIAASPAASAYCFVLRRAIQRFAPDIIHTNGFKMHLLGLWARVSGVPVIWHLHDYVGARPWMSRAMYWHAKRCSGAVANSKSTAEDAEAKFGGRLKVRTVLNGVDLDRFSPAGSKLDLDLASGMPDALPETLRIGLVATLARWKGHETFLRAISLLPDGVRVRGYIIGDALYQTLGSQYHLNELRDLATRLGVADKIGFTGFLSEPEKAMRALDIVVHASTQPEPFGLVIAEAMACGRPVIASCAGGARATIELGSGTLGHVPGDATGLAACMARLADDGSLRTRMGIQARQTAERFFDRGRMTSELISVYRELIPHANRRRLHFAHNGSNPNHRGANV